MLDANGTRTTNWGDTLQFVMTVVRRSLELSLELVIALILCIYIGSG